MRKDGRTGSELRPLKFTPGFLSYPEGSVLVEVGDTRVLCTASLEEKVPPFRKGTGLGWVTAEYAMLPRSTPVRTPREVSRGRPAGRSQEIQRLIGRALRAVVDPARLGERTVWIDCDVLQADGGTRTAAITGGFLAMAQALAPLQKRLGGEDRILRDYLGAVSVGIVDANVVLDLSYEEDSRAEADLNLVMTGSGQMVEVQGGGETGPFPKEVFAEMLRLGESGIRRLIREGYASLPAGIWEDLGLAPPDSDD